MAAAQPHRAAIYVRVSTTDQEPENQLQELRRYLDARGWTAQEFIDRAVPGPAMDSMVGAPPVSLKAGLLLVRVPLGRRKILAQFLRRASRTVAGGITLNAPPFLQRTRVHRVEPELVEQTRNGGLGCRVVAGDDQGSTILRAGRSPVSRELRPAVRAADNQMTRTGTATPVTGDNGNSRLGLLQPASWCRYAERDRSS